MGEIEERVTYPYYNLIDSKMEKGLYLFFFVSLIGFILIAFNLK